MRRLLLLIVFVGLVAGVRAVAQHAEPIAPPRALAEPSVEELRTLADLLRKPDIPPSSKRSKMVVFAIV